MAAVCAFVAGCNALLGNEEHGVATDDASSVVTSDSGAIGATGPSAPDSGDVERDAAERADVQGPAWDGGPGSTSEEDSATESDAGESEDTSAAPPIGFVQAASQDTKASVTTASVTYSKPQQAGDLNVVVVGFSNTSHKVSAISDSAGNTYALAGSPASASGDVLAVYYAANVAGAASNTVTVQLDASDFLCLAVLEYAGVSRVDQTAGGSGAGTTASSGTVITSSARELVFGAGEPDQTGTANFASAGSGFEERVITGVSGMLAEDLVTSEVGTFAATGGLNGSSGWVMEVVTFE